VAEAFAREAFYPPLYPLILGLAGAAHSLALAHAATRCCSPHRCRSPMPWARAGWRAGDGGGGDRRHRQPAVAVDPHERILSEPLFCLLLLAAILALESADGRARKAWLLALLLAALALTRTVALVVVAGYALWC